MSLTERAAALAGDHDSGAAELTARLLPLLSDAIHAGGDAPLAVARVVLTGQPSMAPLWHACAAAVFDRIEPGTFERTRAEMLRAPTALIRAASRALGHLLTGTASPLILTLSYSSSVARALVDAASSAQLRVVCAEGRPRFEGRRLAEELAEAGLEVTAVVDAALTAWLAEAAAVVTGADAITRAHWVNKIGSHGISAAAWHRGVPVYVIAGRDKFVPPILAPQMTLPSAGSDEIWPEAPASIRVHNSYFEATPTDFATAFLTESGVVPFADVGTFAERGSRQLTFLLSRLNLP